MKSMTRQVQLNRSLERTGRPVALLRRNHKPLICEILAHGVYVFP